MAQSIELQAPQPITGIKLNLHLGTKYGISTAHAVIEALQVHRDTMSDLMFEQIREGEYENAYAYYGSFTDLSYQLDNILVEALKVANHNSTAFDHKGQSNVGYGQGLYRLKKDKAERYDTFLKKILANHPGQEETE